MNNDDIDTILLAKKNYKILLGSTIITSTLIFGGFLLLGLTTQEASIYLYCMFFVLATSMTHILGSAGIIPWRPFGKKRAPVPYPKLLSILERQLYKDIESINYLEAIRKKS